MSYCTSLIFTLHAYKHYCTYVHTYVHTYIHCLIANSNRSQAPRGIRQLAAQSLHDRLHQQHQQLHECIETRNFPQNYALTDNIRSRRPSSLDRLRGWFDAGPARRHSTTFRSPEILQVSLVACASKYHVRNPIDFF